MFFEVFLSGALCLLKWCTAITEKWCIANYRSQFISLFAAMIEKGCSIFISLTLAFEFNGRLIRISSYGHIENQHQWLQDQFPVPFTEEGITDWVQEQRRYLNRFETNVDGPLMSSIVKPDGVLYIKRVPVEFPYRWDEDGTGIKLALTIPEGHEIFELLEANKLKAVICMRVIGATWSDTGEDYFSAQRSKWLSNPGAGVELRECEPLAAYWSR